MNPVARQNPNPPAKSTGWQCVHKLLSAMNMAQVPPVAGSGLALHSFPWKALDGELGTAAAVEYAKALASSSEAHAGGQTLLAVSSPPLVRLEGSTHLGQSRDNGSVASGWLSGIGACSRRGRRIPWCPFGVRSAGFQEDLSGILETIENPAILLHIRGLHGKSRCIYNLLKAAHKNSESTRRTKHPRLDLSRGRLLKSPPARCRSRTI